MFGDRFHAGRALGRMLATHVQDSPLVILALPRGGVPVAVEAARKLPSAIQLDIFLVRKLGVPGQEELAFGAIASGGVRVLNRSIIEEMALSNDDIETTIEREELELERRERAYRQGRPPVRLNDRSVVLIDDGLATGATMIAAVRAVRMQQPGKVIVAIPVASRPGLDELRAAVDEVVCLKNPETFFAVGYWYRNFAQVTDDEVRKLLRRFTPSRPAPASTPRSAPQTGGSVESR